MIFPFLIGHFLGFPIFYSSVPGISFFWGGFPGMSPLGPFVNKGGILPLAVLDGGTGASGARYCSYEQLIVAVDFEGVELNRHGPLCLVQMILGAFGAEGF